MRPLTDATAETIWRRILAEAEDRLCYRWDERRGLRVAASIAAEFIHGDPSPECIAALEQDRTERRAKFTKAMPGRCFDCYGAPDDVAEECACAPKT